VMKKTLELLGKFNEVLGNTSTDIFLFGKLHPVRGSVLTRVNSTNVLDEGLRIEEIGRRMNSKVKLVEIGVCRK
jgi:hypothetical protein